MARVSPLVIGVAVGLLAMIAVMLWLSGAIQRRDARRARFDDVLAGHRPARLTPPGGGARLVAAAMASAWPRRLCQLFGMRLVQLQQYRPRWYILLGGALVVGRIGGGVAADSLHEATLVPATLLIWVMSARMAFAALHRARLDLLTRQFPDALGLITRAVRVGIPVVEAIRNVAQEAPEPTAQEFRAIADRLVVGMALEEALAETALRTGLSDYSFFATALSLQARTGGGLAETLDNLADVIRKRVALRARGYALAAEARTSATILTAIPFVTVAILLVVSPAYITALFTTESGKFALFLALGMLGMGILSMRWLIRKSLS